MVDLILTILCSSSIAVILKINTSKNGDSILLLAGNYFSASILAFLLFFSDSSSTSSIELIPVGIFIAFLFVGSIFAFSKSVEYSGAALSTVSSRLSVLVPIILSIFIYSEFPNIYQILGLVLTIITIFLFYISVYERIDKTQNRSKFQYLLFVLIGIGIADFFMKVFQENWQSTDKPWFLLWIFFFSFIITSFLALKRKIKFNKQTLLLGMILGIPNIFSSFFLIEALKSFEAVLVYPIVNMGIIILVLIIVKIVWNELWNFYSKIALLTGLISILLLSI